MNYFIGRLRPPALAAEGNRPWLSPTHHCTVLFAGYLSNRVNLCRQLALPDDTDEVECVAAVYRRYGAHLAAHLFGEFAAAIFDPLDRSLLLVHDALGILPLFYSQQPDEVLFSTHLEPLVFLTGTRELDETCLARYLAVADDLRERTPYRHIQRVSQGTSVTLRNGATTTTTVYTPAQVEPLHLKTQAAYEERFRELVTEAVASALPTSGKVWCELSGGLDSSTLVSLTSGVLHAPVETFSLHFSRSHEADETHWREIVLEAFPLPSHLLDADKTPPFSTVPQHFQPEPTGTSLVCALDHARRALFLHHRVDVVLTGMCGD
ncbi:MAG: asparagine synthase-related protein, partial [Bryocella sp.]